MATKKKKTTKTRQNREQAKREDFSRNYGAAAEDHMVEVTDAVLRTETTPAEILAKAGFSGPVVVPSLGPSYRAREVAQAAAEGRLDEVDWAVQNSGRRPVTFTPDQWSALSGLADDIRRLVKVAARPDSNLKVRLENVAIDLDALLMEVGDTPVAPRKGPLTLRYAGCAYDGVNVLTHNPDAHAENNVPMPSGDLKLGELIEQLIGIDDLSATVEIQLAGESNPTARGDALFVEHHAKSAVVTIVAAAKER